MIGDDVEVVLTRIERDSVRIAIRAPREVRIFRGELYQKNKLAQEEGDEGSESSQS